LYEFDRWFSSMKAPDGRNLVYYINFDCLVYYIFNFKLNDTFDANLNQKTK